MNNITQINMNIAKLDKIPADFAKTNCINKACELLEVM